MIHRSIVPIWTAFLVIGVWLACTSVNAQQGQQGEALLKTDLMGVFAHPDDETGVASTLAHYALGQGRVVANIYCTRGEGGGNMVGTQWGASLGVLREAELRQCLQRLGVKYCYFLDRRDFAYTESLLATFQRWNKEETLRGLVRYIRALRPEVILTMDPAPTPGQHGNHQAAGVLATEAFTAAADPARFPDQISIEGLHVWQVKKLYYSGWDTQLPTVIAITNALSDGRFPWQVAGEALAAHRSQGFGNFGANPRMRRAQMFRPVMSVLPAAPEDDLFQGLPAAPDIKPVAVLKSGPANALVMDFQPRVAISNYNRWIKDRGIEAVAKPMPAEVSVVAGEGNEVRLQVFNPQKNEQTGQVNLTASEGWTLKPSLLSYRLPPGRLSILTARVTPPVVSHQDGFVEAITTTGSAEIKAKLQIHAVPLLKAPHASEEPAMEWTERGWESALTVAIPSTSKWEGSVRDEADSSAVVRLLTHARTLFVEVAVRDDVVVTNIGPDDIRGHWRSDSVEVCIDPVGGAENTFATYKLGIFPFDTTGVVKAARDADANPGPIAQTAPKTQVASVRTLDGYRIRVAIPYSELGIAFPKRIGFNVLIYDGDKANAALGENINKSRLALAPRSGVQGRPEDWARLDLD